MEKLDGIKWGIKVPHPEVIVERKNEVEERDVEEEVWQQAWPEAEDELKSLMIGDDSASTNRN